MNVEPDEIEQTLIRTARLAEENNKILRRMQRAQRTAAFMRFVQWILILGSFAVLYYLIQPFIAEIKALTESYRTMLDSGTEGVRYEALESFLDNFGLSEEAAEPTQVDVPLEEELETQREGTLEITE